MSSAAALAEPQSSGVELPTRGTEHMLDKGEQLSPRKISGGSGAYLETVPGAAS